MRGESRKRGYRPNDCPIVRVFFAQQDYQWAILKGEGAQKISQTRDRWLGIYREAVKVRDISILEKLGSFAPPSIGIWQKLCRRIAQLKREDANACKKMEAPKRFSTIG